MAFLSKIIPTRYYDEFTEKEVDRVKRRLRLSILFFIPSFIVGTGIASFLVTKTIPGTLFITWVISTGVCAIVFIFARHAKSLTGVKLWAALFSALLLLSISQFQVSENLSPFETMSVYLIMLFALVLTIPWSNYEILGVSAMHFAAYSIYFFDIGIYFPSQHVPPRDLSSFARGFVMISIATFICYIVTKRERLSEIQNFILLKTVQEKNRQMQSELELANRVHARLIPNSANTRLANIAATYLPVHYMGGDYAKFKLVDDKHLLFLICDVTGHGVPAALLVNSLHTEFERLTQTEKDPGRLLKVLDQFISEDFKETSMFLTAFCGLLDYEKMQFTYSNYGHLPQYRFKITDSDITGLPPQTTMIGVQHAFDITGESDSVYEDSIPFTAGDKILLFTDGVTETRARDGEEFGAGRLESYIRENSKLNVKAFNDNLIKELREFSGRPFHDDIFILNIQTK